MRGTFRTEEKPLKPQDLIPLIMTVVMAFTTGCGVMAPSVSDRSVGAHQIQQAALKGTASPRAVIEFRPGAGGRGLSELMAKHGVRSVGSIPELGMNVVSLPKGRDRAGLLKTLAAHPDVASVEADARVRASYIPTDPQHQSQYGNNALRLPKAWDVARGKGVIVAVIDTGVDLGHPDLRENLVSGISFVNQVEVEDWENPGQTVVEPFANKGPLDDHGHGTHVAGTIAAAMNGVGVVGAAPNAKIMPIKVLSYTRSGFGSDVAAGIVWAVEHGAKVINLSLGVYGGSKPVERAVRYALTKGAVVVAAMGNDREDSYLEYGIHPSYPAALPGVIAVGATDDRDQTASFSNAGKWISVSAPGVDILSTTPTYEVSDPLPYEYGAMSGTSMSTPYVSGVAALLLSLYPQMTPAQVKARLESTADDVGLPGFDTFTGHGRINAARALGLN
jgi:type VII secretion-associated serine protease mycosin